MLFSSDLSSVKKNMFHKRKHFVVCVSTSMNKMHAETLLQGLVKKMHARAYRLEGGGGALQVGPTP